jgi:ribonucleoside-diphosphate reductase alpha chain
MSKTTTANYHGLDRNQIREVLSKKSKLEQGLTAESISSSYNLSLENAQYLDKVLDVGKFYAHRASPEGDSGLEETTLKNKYLAPNESGPMHLWDRIADAMASQELTSEDREKWYFKYMNALDDFAFVPGGRILHGAGRDDIKTTLNNCYVVGIKEDSMEGILDALNEEALTYKFGGGCGHDLSILRPKGSSIEGTGGGSCGPVGFMDLYSTMTDTIAQHGRRGANMQTIRVDHPDVKDFISIKENPALVKYSNVSVLLTHEFMDAVEADGDFDLQWSGEKYETIRAKELWNSIISHAHSSAEPGIIFWDTMKDFHNAEYVSPLVSTNPCGEQPLPDGGSCNLGALNLARFVTGEGDFMWDEFGNAVELGVRFQDSAIDYNLERHALPVQKENALNDRRVGLGILGVGDELLRRGIKYDTIEAIDEVEGIMSFMRDRAYKTSIELAKEKGIFPNFDWEGYSKSKYVQSLPQDIQDEIREHGIRNSTLLTVAPTGTGAIISEVTSGIEPMFSTHYERDLKNNSEEEGVTGETLTFKVMHPEIQKRKWDLNNLPPEVVTAHDVDPMKRIKMQGVIQKYIDSSISSTINLPEDVSVETVSKIYLAAYHEGLKGVTVYREGSREGVMRTEKSSNENKLEKAVKIFKERPNVVGTTKMIKRVDGNLYITTNKVDAEGDLNEMPYEVFVSKGKSGKREKSYAEANARLISLALHYNIPVEEITHQLKGITDEVAFNGGGAKTLSDPDAIGQVMDEFFLGKPMGKKSEEDNKKVKKSESHLEICPDCHEKTLEVTGGCAKCTNSDGCTYDAC